MRFQIKVKVVELTLPGANGLLQQHQTFLMVCSQSSEEEPSTEHNDTPEEHPQGEQMIRLQDLKLVPEFGSTLLKTPPADSSNREQSILGCGLNHGSPAGTNRTNQTDRHLPLNIGPQRRSSFPKTRSKASLTQAV